VDGGLTEKIVYDESVRAIEQQVRSLDELRARTAIVLAAAGVSSAFLGQAAIDDGVGAFGYFAIGFFVATALACVWVLIPRWGAWTFANSAEVLIREHIEVPERNNDRKLYRFLAEIHESHYDRNRDLLGPLFTCFWFACVALAVDILLWMLELAIG
jgi:hypothetical protein